MNSTKTEIFCLSLQPATPWQLPWSLHSQDCGYREGETSDCISWILVGDHFNWIPGKRVQYNNDLTGPEYKVGVLGGEKILAE